MRFSDRPAGKPQRLMSSDELCRRARSLCDQRAKCGVPLLGFTERPGKPWLPLDATIARGQSFAIVNRPPPAPRALPALAYAGSLHGRKLALAGQQARYPQSAAGPEVL